MSRLKLILMLVSFSLLAGCEPEMVCPVLKQYTEKEVLELARVYSKLPLSAQNVISDYRLMRKQCDELEKLKWRRKR